MHSCHVMIEGFFLMSTWIPNPQSTSDTPESRTHCCSSINDLTWYSEQNQPPVKGVCMDVRATSSTTENESCSQKADLNNIYNSKAFLVETTLHMCHWNDICILLNTCHKILVSQFIFVTLRQSLLFCRSRRCGLGWLWLGRKSTWVTLLMTRKTSERVTHFILLVFVVVVFLV